MLFGAGSWGAVMFESIEGLHAGEMWEAFQDLFEVLPHVCWLHV
jgi:hypothetical protein